LKEIITKCLDPSIENRYNNFYQVQEDLNDLKYPKGVTSYHQDLSDDTINFIKEDKVCSISVEIESDKYNLTSKKNGRNVNSCRVIAVIKVKIAKELLRIAGDI